MEAAVALSNVLAWPLIVNAPRRADRLIYASAALCSVLKCITHAFFPSMAEDWVWPDRAATFVAVVYTICLFRASQADNGSFVKDNYWNLVNGVTALAAGSFLPPPISHTLLCIWRCCAYFVARKVQTL